MPIQTAKHSLRRSFALTYSRNPYDLWTSQPLEATTRPVPWAHYSSIVVPPQASNAPWLLAESQWNGLTGFFTLFHFDPQQRHWTAFDPIPLGVRGGASPGIT